MSTSVTLGFNEHQVSELAKRAITPEQAVLAGVIPVLTDADRVPGMDDWWCEAKGVLPGMLYPLVSPTPGVAPQYQIKPDVPFVGQDGVPRKYLFPKGYHPVLHTARHEAGNTRALLVEGTHQVIAAALYAPAGWDVYGISGCWSWQSGGAPTDDLLALMGKSDAIVVLDADAGTNLQVYTAGLALAADLEIYGVQAVRFGQVPGTGKDGLDDVLAKRPESVRHRLMDLLIRDAIAKPAPAKPSAAVEARRARAAERERNEEAEAATDAATGLVRFDVSREKKVIADEMVQLLATRLGGVHLFNRAGVLTLREKGRLRDLGKAGLLNALCQLARPGRASAQGVWEEVWPDDNTLSVVLVERYDDFPELEQIVAAPFVRADGTVCTVNGYDEASRTYLEMAPELAARISVPDEPTEGDVRSAVKLLLDDWLADFPFPTPADRANALAWMLTPFIRSAVDVVPIAVVDGNGPAAGKGLLAELFSRLVLGSGSTPTTLPADNEEMRKAITGALLAARPTLIWDEAHVLEGTALALLLTAPSWGDRRLGSSEMVQVPNRVTFAALGNNVSVNGDVGRRAYRIRIHPEMERPEDRDVNSFRHPDIKGWTDEHRAELLSAVLTLVRAWHVAGRPAGPSDFGSFEKWSRMVGGILANAGVPDFLVGRREWLADSNETVDMWSSHLAWLRRTFKGRPFSARVAGEKLAGDRDAPMPGSTRVLLSPSGDPAYARALGQCYRHHVDQKHGGFTLQRAYREDNTVMWAVVGGDDEGEDKTDMGTLQLSDIPVTSPESSVSPVNQGSRGEEGSLNRGSTRGAMRIGKSDTENPIRIAHVGGPAQPIPASPTTPLATYRTSTGQVPPWASQVAQPYTSQCSMGHTEVLVDGLWFSCPVCHPSTPRTTIDKNEAL